ncbi:hypothetical protein IW148_000521 [Coemansia sp. RSA 1199]|nr:hypothetical protein IW148_000521 [Coemansia sp. RSA 1199]
MYIPASSTSFMQSRCSSAATLTVEHQDAVPRHPSFSLRLQSSTCRSFFPQKKKQQRTVYTPPSIVRKNSGEVVRPCLRKRSATTTSTPVSERCASPVMMRTPRFVHFGADLEYVRWFLKAQSPKAAREDAEPDYCSASEDDRQTASPACGRRRSQSNAERASTVRLTALKRPAPSFTVYEESPVVFELAELADNRRSSAALRGTVKVHNVAFEKEVTVRYSFDQWRTAGEVTAEFSRTLAESQGARPGIDRFAFQLSLPPSFLVTLPGTVALCVRYRVAGAEHWDNNKGANYSFKLAPPAEPAIADDDCDTLPTRPIDSPELRAPRRLSFGQPSNESPRFAAPSAADTRRYMAQSAALFGASSAGRDGTSSPYMQQPLPMHAAQPELPLYQEVAWHGGSFADAPLSMSMASASPPLSSSFHQAFLPLASDAGLCAGSPLAEYAASIGRPVSLPASASAPLLAAFSVPARSASPLAAPMRIGSPIHRAVFDSEGAVRTGSPLAWSHNTTASALQC